jgi:hypothetical protein
LAKKKNIQSEITNSLFNTFDIEKFIPSKYHALSAFVIMILLIVIFFAPTYFDGKVFQSGDIVTQKSYQTLLEKNETVHWNPYIFTGMPFFGGAGWNDIIGNTIRHIRIGFTSLLSNPYAGFSFYIFILGFAAFYLARYFKANAGISLFVSLSTIFSIGLISLLFEGHVNKLSTAAIIPLILLMVLRLTDKIKLLDTIILILAIKYLFSQWHVQIIFYTYSLLVIYFAYYIIRALAKKQNSLVPQYLKVGGILTIATVISFSMHYYRMGQMYEYTPYSTRGEKSVLDLETQSKEKSEEDYYQYSTNWSFSPGEVLTFIVPSYYGFGNSVYKGPLTQGREVEVSTYFGQMPFTHAPMYMGIIVLALALFAIFMRWKEPFVQFLTISSILIIIVSFGRNFPLLFDILFFNMPFFDKFRAPVMVLHVIQITTPLLAGLGLMKLIELGNSKDEKIKKIILFSLIGFGAFLFLSVAGSSGISSWFIERIKEAGQKGTRLQPLFDYMADMFTTDLQIAFLFLTLLTVTAYAYITEKINSQILIAIVLLLSMIDIWRINDRALNYEDGTAIEQQFEKPTYIKVIEEQKDKDPYRLFNIKQDQSLGSLNYNSNFHVHFLQEDFYGYSALKPRSYQDYIDVVGVANLTMWRMLNVKYLISEKPLEFPGLKPIYQDDKTVVSLNELALPRAYFVDSLAVSKGLEMLNKVKQNSFDPKNIAFVDEPTEIKIEKPDSTASIKITSYSEENIEMTVNASGNNLIFVGNTFYPLGWKAFIDGTQTEILKLNHGYMGIVVPKGKHSVTLDYKPDTYEIGKILALALNLLLLAGIGLVIFKSRRK